MSQSGFTPIQLYRSATPGAVPLAGNLAPGELAINTADQKLFFENASGTVVASLPFNTTGVLDVANGGTGASTLTANYILKGNGASAVSSSVLYENGGYLGIGTTGPVVLFDAQQTLNGSGGISYTNLSTGASSAASITAEAGGSYLTLNVTRATGVVQFRGVTATTLNQDFTTQIFRSTGGSEYMRITSAGNVGIGTAAPTGTLEVSQASTATPILQLTATASTNPRIVFTDIVGSSAIVGGGGIVYIRTGGTAAINNQVTVIGSGNVGVGTNYNNPPERLSVNGNVRLSDGNNIYWGGTANYITGSNASNYLALATSSAERMRITLTGDVGIGTTVPGAKLEVSSTSAGATAEVLRLNNPGGGANTAAQIKFLAAGANYASVTGGYGAAAPQMTFNLPAGAGNYVWQNASVEQMRLDTSGNLGVGATAPVGRLNVRGEDASNVIGSSTASINITNFDANGLGRTANLNFTLDDGNITTRRLATIAAVYTGFGGGGTEGALAFATQFNGSLNERMRIASGGNVGIGTSAPGYKLDVSATGNISGQFKTSGSLNALFLADAGTTAEALYVGTVGNDFRVVTGSNERMRVTSVGDVGVGTTAPATGSISNTAILNAGVFTTLKGSVSAGSGVATTLATVPSSSIGLYVVTCGLAANDPTNYTAIALVSIDSSTLRLTSLQTAGSMVISISGLNIRATQSAGITATILYNLTRIA